MKIYHTETQADYDALMVELEAQGCAWGNREVLTKGSLWKTRGDATCVYVSDAKIMTVAKKSFFEKYGSEIPIIKYKAKADEKMKFTKDNVYKLFSQYRKDGISLNDLQDGILKLDDTPEKVVVPKFVADWIESKKYLNIWKMIDDLRNGNSLEKSVINWLRGEYSKYGLSDQFDLLSLIKIYGYTIEPEQLYYIPLPGLETADGIQQVLSQRKGNKHYFACRPNEKLKQRFTKEELKRVPVSYKPYAKLIEEEEE